MPNLDDNRIQVSEQLTSMASDDLADSLKEIDARVMDSNSWNTITYDGDGLISKIEYFSDSAKTKKTIKRDFTRTTGTDGLKYITSISTTIYNDDGSTDSTITTTLTRTSDKITSCSSVFSTTEPAC